MSQKHDNGTKKKLKNWQAPLSKTDRLFVLLVSRLKDPAQRQSAMDSLTRDQMKALQEWRKKHPGKP